MASRKPKGRKVGYILAGSMGFMLALALAFFVVAMPADSARHAIFVANIGADFAARRRARGVPRLDQVELPGTEQEVLL